MNTSIVIKNHQQQYTEEMEPLLVIEKTLLQDISPNVKQLAAPFLKELNDNKNAADNEKYE